ncbi:hypothetical protein GF391_02190 [Candidatus Uhrbacteria bacterium]|nr:hypothetical protein [Candidatus Uhrbacteria bacterium]
MRRIPALVTTLAVFTACSAEAPKDKEAIGQAEQEIIAPGMLQPNYSPVAQGATPQLVAPFNPFMGQVPENFRIRVEEGTAYAYVSSTILPQQGPPSAELIKVNLQTGAQSNIPIPFSIGAFASGIDFSGDDIIGALAFLNENGPPTGSLVYKYDGTSFTELVGVQSLQMAGLNGLVVKNGMWYSADTTNPMGFIWAGPVTGGAAFPWFSGPETSPDPNYIPVPGGPPAPFGVNGIQDSGRILFDSLVFSNVTTGQVGEIFIDEFGQPGNVESMYDTSAYLDDIAQDHCGILRKGTFATTNGGHQVGFLNPYRPCDGIVEIMDGSACDGPVAAAVHDGKLYALCSGSPLIPRPDPGQPPFPGAPALMSIDLDPAYLLMCQ